HQIDSASASWTRAARFRTITQATVVALTKFAEFEWHQQHIPEAIASWERLTTEFFYTSVAESARQSLVKAYIVNNQYDDAITLITSLSNADTSLDYSYFLAEAYEKKGDRQKATHYYNM